MESAEDDPVGFAQLRSGSGYVERTADQTRSAHGTSGRSAGEVGVSPRFKHYYNISRDALRSVARSAQRDNDDLYDTAPFDVKAFLDYLEAGASYNAAAYAAHHHGGDKGPAPAYVIDLDGEPVTKLRTHYYGDDCPGGHYNYKHPADYHNDYTSDAYYDAYYYDDNGGAE